MKRFVRSSTMMLGLALGLGAAPALARRDVERALADLAAPALEQRAAAQRWLTVHLERSDFPELVEGLRSGGAELRERVIRALAGDERHLGLCALLATDGDLEARAVGERALAELALAFLPAAAEPPRSFGAFPEDWAELNQRRLAIDPTQGDLAQLIDRLDRLGSGPVPLVLDPRLDTDLLAPFERSGAGREDEVGGTWLKLVPALARLHRVGLRIYAYEDRAQGPMRGFCLIEPRTEPEQETSAAELLVEWCRGSLSPADRAWNVACSRALAATGWSAALDWLAERWFENDDEAALEALLFAAAKGRVEPAFATRAVVADLVARVDARLAQDAPGAARFAGRVARALAAMGPTSLGGEPLAAALLDDWSTLSDRQLWVRLVALEAFGSGVGEARARAAEVLASTRHPSLRIQAIHTLFRISASADPAPQVGQPTQLLLRAIEEGALLEISSALMALRAELPSGGWIDQLYDPVRIQIAVLGWALHAGETQRASALMRRLLDRSEAFDALVRNLREWASLGSLDVLAQVFAERDNFDPTEILRVAVWLDEADAAMRTELLQSCLSNLGSDPDRMRDLAFLVAREDTGPRARAAFLDALENHANPTFMESALASAFQNLRREHYDWELATFRRQALAAARRAKHPLLERLEDSDWPPPLDVKPRRLELRDRRLLF